MIIDTFTVGPLACNCTILGDETTGLAVVVDPGDDSHVILDRLAQHGLTLSAMIATHAHIDHVSAVSELQDATSATVALHEKDLFLFEHLDTQADWLGVAHPKPGSIDRFLNHGDAVTSGLIDLEVLHTPGHTPGSLTFHMHTDRRVLFTGDTLFLRGVGRTDLWGGSMPDLMNSIRTQLLCFDDETYVIPGHGPSTTIGGERRDNPFLR